MFVSTMVLHGELARLRPPPERLTEFYFWMSLGGVVGGMIIGPILLLLIVPTLNFEILRRIKPKKLDVEPEEPHEV